MTSSIFKWIRRVNKENNNCWKCIKEVIQVIWVIHLNILCVHVNMPLKYIIKLNIDILFKSKECKFKKLKVVAKGFCKGLFFNPSIEYIK